MRKVHFERTGVIIKMGNQEVRGALTCFQLPISVCSQRKVMGKRQSHCLPPRCRKDV